LRSAVLGLDDGEQKVNTPARTTGLARLPAHCRRLEI
jgi:hypothetical protein